MEKKTVIFIGRSGCGKGTQAALLKKYLENNENEDKDSCVFYLGTGSRFREFIKEDGFTNKLSRSIYKTGDRQPDFLAVYIWSHLFIENLSGNKHIIIDGTPRSLTEAKILHTAIKFYDRKKTSVVYLNVSEQLLIDRIHGRGRIDDLSDETIKKRFEWFESDVMPAVEYYRESSNYNFLEINGEQPVDDIFDEIISLI